MAPVLSKLADPTNRTTLQPELPSPSHSQSQPCSATTASRTSTNGAELLSNYRQILDLITPIVDESQYFVLSPKKMSKQGIELLNRMKVVRDQCSLKHFGKVLFVLLCPVFQVDSEEEYARNIVNFVFYMSTKMDTDDESEIAEKAKLRDVLFRRCAKEHSDSRAIIRENITKLCIRLIDTLDNVETLSEKILEALESMFLHRIKDKNSRVRVYGAIGLKHFQLEEDPAVCEVTKSLQFHAEYDPHTEVRRMALKSLKVNKSTLESILKSASDINPSVRAAALTIIAKCVPMGKVRIDDREKILEMGLEDKSNEVKKAAQCLVDAWLQEYNGDILRFLSKMDVVAKRKPCYLALDYIYDNGSTEAFKKIDLNLWTDKLIPFKKLTEESAFYWKYVAARYRKNALCADLVVPPAYELCTYLKKYYDVFESRFASRHGATVLEQLFGVLTCASMVCEEGGRREILELIRATLDFTYIDVVQVNVILGLIYSLVEPKKIDSTVFELIEDMLLDSQNDPVLAGVATSGSQPTILADAAEAVDLNESLAQKLEYGALIHKKHNLMGQKANALAANDYALAGKLHAEIEELNTKAEAIRPVQKPSTALSQDNTGSATQTVSQNEGQYTATLMETDDDETIQKEDDPNIYLPAVLQFALATFLEHMQRQKKPSATAITFYKTYIIQSIMSNSEEVRVLALQCLGIMGLTDAEDAVSTMQMCLRAILFDHESIGVAAFRTMIDLILHYGFDYFEDPKIQQLAEKGKRANFSNSLLEEQGPGLKMHILDQLNSNDQVMVRLAATGFMKLMLGNRIHSSKLISRILTMWINPVYAGSELYENMSLWLPTYAKMGLEQGLLIADALLPALRKVVYAGRSSPLADASPEKLVSFVAASTSIAALEKIPNAVVIHEKLVNNVLAEINNLGPCAELPVLGKTLKFFNLRGLEEQALNILSKKVTKLTRFGGNKSVTQSLNAFLKHLNAEQLRLVDKDNSASTVPSPEVTCPVDENESDEGALHIVDSSEED